MESKHNSFGGDWTESKLELLTGYLRAYCTIFNKHPKLEPTYLDAFAGSGRVEQRPMPGSADEAQNDLPLLDWPRDPDTKRYLAGSTRRALALNPGFKHYVFVETHPRRWKLLQNLREEFPTKDITIRKEEANAVVKEWCVSAGWNDRACLFLDPFGMNVDWTTVTAVADSHKVDMWYWFPMMAVVRQLTKAELPPPAWQAALDRTLGTGDWREVFYPHPVQQSLFDEEVSERRIETIIEPLKDFVTKRLVSAFGDGVAPNPKVFTNSKGSPMYLLCFATSATNASARSAALNIARHLLERDKRWVR